MKQRFSLIFMLLLMAAQASLAADHKSQVSEICELVSTVCRLAGYDEYNNNAAINYAAAVDSTFNPFKEHAAVQFLKEKRAQRELAYDAMMDYACFTEIYGDSIRIKEITSFDHLAEHDSRWTTEDAKRFTNLLNDFYHASDFHNFFTCHRLDYEKAEQWVDAYIIPEVDFDWFVNLFGIDKTENLSVIPSMLNRGNYGVPVENPQSGEYFPHVVIGPQGTDSIGSPTYYRDGGILLHEFTHSFVNPPVSQYEDTLSALCEPYFDYAQDLLRKRAYGEALTMAYETLVRVCNVIYDRDHGDGADEIDSSIKQLMTGGFPLSGVVYDALINDYSAERTKYPTFADYMPRLIEIISSTEPYTVIDYIESNMGEISVTGIEDGATDVPSGKVTIRLHFTKPHKYGFGFSRGRGNDGEIPDIDGMPKRDENGDLIITLLLEPGQKYDFSLPGSFFRTEDRWPMKNTIYLTFETAPEN